MISKDSGAGICSDSAFQLCNQLLEEYEEAVYVGLPGAGGDDAIFVIVSTIDPPSEPTEDAESLQKFLDDNIEGREMAVLPVGVTQTAGPIISSL